VILLQPLGQISAPFTINAINDARLDGTQSLTITPQTGGVNGIHDNLDILDDAVTINMAVVPAGSGTASGPGTVDPDGGPFAISATANGTHVFTGWSTTHGSITGNQIDGLTANATVTAHFNGRPIVVDDSYTTLEDTPLTGDVSDNDSDPEGDPTTYHLVSRSGQLTLNTDGSFSYLPAPDFNGRVAFTYRANDGADSANNATITIDVLPVNDCPVADDQAIVLGEDDDVRGQLTAFDADGPLVGVIGSARSYDAVPTASTQSVDAVGTASYARSGPFSTHAPPAHGALEIDPDGSFTYATLGAFNHLAVGETATDAFTFLVTDGECSDIGTVVLTIHGANDLPTTVADSATTDEDTAFVFDLLANDEDVDSPLSLVSWTSPNYDGTTYTPVPDFHGEETFVYEVNDGVTGVATVVIRPINDPPVNTALPAITGIAASGETVGVTPGVWNDDDDLVPGTITLSYQWLRDGTDIPGASGSSYTLVDADVGTALSVRETATNTGEGTPVTVTASAESPAREVGWRVHIGTIARAGSLTFGMSSGASVGADAFDTADDTPPLTLHNLGLTLSADWRPIADSASWLLHSDSFDELVLNFTASALPGDRYLSIYEVRGEFDLEPTGASAARLEGDGSFVVPPGPRWFLIRYGSSLSSIYIFRPGYNLISFPYQPDGNARGIFIQDGQHVDLGDLTYVFGGEDRLAGAVEAYRGYWLFTPRREIVRVEGIPAPRRLTIAPGWNSIGVDVEMGLPWALRSRLHFWSYGFRKTNRLIPQRGYLADFADSELSW
jgi:VCBS repeat-containing protein